MADGEKHDTLLSIGLILVMLLVWAFLVFWEPAHGLDPNYITLYSRLAMFSIIGIVVLWAIGRAALDEEEFGAAPFDSGAARLLASIPWTRTVALVLLVVVFLAGAGSVQSSFIPIVNPYDSSKLLTNTQQLSTAHGTTVTAFRSAVYPALFEDGTGFVFVLAVMLILLFFVFKRFDEDATESPTYIILSLFLACLLWAATFSTAHALAYGLDSQAYLDAAIYGFSSQLVNGLVGAPVSMVAHAAHNFSVVIAYSITFAIAGTAGFIWWKKKREAAQ